ncbi:MAG: ABC transporter permease [Gammaproteobacteria bacterium HGW-Gammaproteobacteria-2]|nr:MAG: ABC transporter permease [Gammaproteobacteria bacterium HGW-Gammaproteobacteria-2]
MSYPDTQRLLASGQGVRRTAIFGLNDAISPVRADMAPLLVNGGATTSDFFAMFEVPFRYGNPWHADDDARKADVIVLSRATSEKLFGDVNPVGRELKLGDASYRVVGVFGDWKPLPRYYRIINGNGGAFAGSDEFFIPFSTAVRHEKRNSGNNNCNGDGPQPGYAGWIASDCTWIQFWFEGANAADQATIKAWLDDYASEQRRLGWFKRPVNTRLRNTMQWLEHLEVVGRDSRIQVWLAFGFLLVCLVNTVGLLLAKFSARAGEIGVRRALGATRREIFQQYLIEASVVGLVGAVLGLALSFAGLWLIGKQSGAMAAVAKMDWSMLLATLLLSLLASLIAGFLPTWRACQVRPALQLKSQ